MESITDYRTLRNMYLKTKNDLDEAEKTLEKMLGPNINMPSISFQQKKLHVAPERNSMYQRTSINQSKLNSSSESSEKSSSDEEFAPKKKAVQSAVVASSNELRSRKMFCRQNSDAKVQSRNRRMLGMVQSTLQQFKNEEIKRKPQDLKRKKALERVEAAEEEEKISVKRQKGELLSSVKEKRLGLDCLRKMMKIVESFELWEKNQKHLLNYIATETKPCIFFLPAKSTPESEQYHGRSRKIIKAHIEERRISVEKALATIKENHKLSSLNKSMENNSSAETDVPEKAVKQMTESCGVEEKVDFFPEESLCLDLSEDEANFLL